MLEDAAGLIEQRTSGGREHGFAPADEQAATELGFELLNLLGERRLSDADARRGAAEVEFLGDGGEVTKLPEIHMEIISIADDIYIGHIVHRGSTLAS